MEMQSQHREGGWITSFAIVAVLLIAGLLTGIYYLKTQSTKAESNDKDTPAIIAETPGKDQGTNYKKEESKPPSQTESDAKKLLEGNTDNSKKEAQPQPTPAQSAAGQGSSKSTQSLPQSGPADSLIGVAILGLLSFAVVVYTRSEASVRT